MPRSLYDEEHSAVVALGTTDQVKRHEVGLLSDFEFRELIRQNVFGPAMVEADGHPIPRFETLWPRDVQHERGCTARHEDEIRFDSEDYRAPLSLEQQRIVLGVQDRARSLPYPHEVLIRRHVAWCSLCPGRTQRLGLLVRMTYAGRIISREYWLESGS